jgi:hypothetical protein
VGLGGLVDDLLGSSELEAWEVDPEVSLQADADSVTGTRRLADALEEVDRQQDEDDDDQNRDDGHSAP